MKITEIWKTIYLLGDRYDISDLGKVKSFANSEKGVLIKGKNSNGYFQIDKRIAGNKKISFLLHRLVAETFSEKTDNNQQKVIHLDFDKKNNHATNLNWASNQEAYQHQIKHSPNTLTGFVQNTKANAKLSEEDVTHIRKMLEKGVSQTKIAYMFCVSPMQISRIKRGENWKKIEAKEQPKRKRIKTIKQTKNYVAVKNKKNK